VVKIKLENPYNLQEIYNDIGEKYPEEQIVYASLGGMLRKEFVKKKLPLLKGKLLDAGCNIGVYTKEFNDGEYVGIDISEFLIKKAKKNNTEFQFSIQELGYLGFQSKIFDGIICIEVIEHLPDITPIIIEFHRILKPGGKLFITTPNYLIDRPSWVHWEIYDKFKVQNREIFHTAYKPKQLKKLMEDNGFEIIEYGSFGQEEWIVRKIVNILNIGLRIIKRKKIRNIFEIIAESPIDVDPGNVITYEKWYMEKAHPKIGRMFHFFKFESIFYGTNTYVIVRGK
jgi:2-polyprenyl-3-methyl-5-hydroxy-6-metoxy-1,4-benzoquinol methylase